MRLAQIMAKVMRDHADRPAVGERVREPVRDPDSGRVSLRLLPECELTTYDGLSQRVQALAGVWHTEMVRPGDKVAILGFTSRDYVTVDLACIHLGAVAVPLQTSSSGSQLQAVISETEPVVVAVGIDRVDAAVEAVLKSPFVRRVLVFDHHDEVDDHRDKVADARARLADADRDVVVECLSEILRRPALPPVPPFVPGDDENPLAMLIYTSGSSGTPKGAMYTERLAAGMWGGGWSKLFSEEEAVTVNYMPMSHVAGHSSLKNTMARGGISYFTAAADLSTLFEDIALARPTELSLVPRVCEMIHQRYRGEVERRVAGGDDRHTAEEQVLTEMRETAMGGRVRWASSASAPLSAELTTFVESLLGVPLHNVYGSTEAGGVSVDGELLRPPVIDYKLVDVPELGYYRTDVPHPRGELLIKTNAVIPGYYKQPELTAALFDDEGYYRTGDVVAELRYDRLAVVDRRSSVLKLSQGEFVATARLESVFAASPLVRQIFVYGNSERSYLLAVVVPTAAALDRFTGREDALKQALRESLHDVARDSGLNPYEVPRDVLVDTEPFSQENGLLSDHRKLLRPQTARRYRDRLEQLYSSITTGEAERLATVRRVGPDQPVLDTVVQAVRALWGGSAPNGEADDGIDPSAQLRDLGGDSLSAVAMTNLLHDVFDVRVPVDVLLSPANDLRGIAQYIEKRRDQRGERADFTSIHNRHSDEVRAADLTLGHFLDPQLLRRASHLPRAAGVPRTVLLSGGAGYLGRFVCLEWLEQLSLTGGKLICLVRGQDDDTARTRLYNAFDSGDATLVRRFRELAEDTLEVLAGDLSQPRSGQGEETWARLATEVDLIVHAGAMVNHVLPYPHLFEANVSGTAELIGLALTERVKPFVYISSVAVAHAHPSKPLDEDADVRMALPVQPVGGGYAVGYSTSKWAGEVLLREAHDLYGLPVTTFRSSMILAHPDYTGQLNLPDMFTRLLHGIVATGIAPRSFYRADDHVPSHYDGLPVDFTAAAVVALGGTTTHGYRTFSLVNPHEDGISLDTVVGWLREAGHHIEIVDDYHDWFNRFENALRGLPEALRKHSALPVLHGYAEPEGPVPGSAVPSDRFHAEVRAGAVPGFADIPHLTPELIAKYIEDLRPMLT